MQSNDEVQIDIDDNVEETQEDLNPYRDHINDIPEPVVQKAKEPLPKPLPPYPQRLTKQNGENQFKNFIQMMKSLSINVPLVEAVEQMPDYAKFMKDLVTKKRSMNFETIKVTHQVSAIVHSMAPKLEDPGAFTIHCTIRSAKFAKALYDLGRHLRVVEDVLVCVDKFILPADFFILDCEVDYEALIILGRPFLATGKGLCDVETGELTFRVGDEIVVFHECKSVRQPNSNEVYSLVDLVTDVIVDDTIATINVGDMLESVLLSFDDDEIDGFMEYSTSALMPVPMPTSPLSVLQVSQTLASLNNWMHTTTTKFYDLSSVVAAQSTVQAPQFPYSLGDFEKHLRELEHHHGYLGTTWVSDRRTGQRSKEDEKVLGQ
ncbi:uncharacterized protein [Nicotiana tomentosiformis]|uniref:uncharacterized protein n=1 Tax=Nicotiana tomentosiformis TaxID=4098 RepID=UPI00388C6C76